MRDANATRLATVSDGTRPTRSSSLSDTFPVFALWLHSVPGMGQSGTGRGRHEQRKQRDQRERQQQRERTTGMHAVIFFVIVFLLSSFLCLTLLLFRLFLFRQLQQQAGHERKAPAGRARPTGTSSFLSLFFFLLSSFLLLAFTISFVANCGNKWGGAK